MGDSRKNSKCSNELQYSFNKDGYTTDINHLTTEAEINQNKVKIPILRPSDTSKPENLLFTDQRQKRYWQYLILNSWMGHFFVGQLLSLYSQMFPHLAVIFDWTGRKKTFYISIINSLTFFGAIFGAILVAIYKNRFGRRQYLIIADVLLIIATILSVIVSTPLILLSRLIQGIVFGILISINSKYCLEFAPTKYKGTIGQAAIIWMRLAIYFNYILGYGLPSDVNNTSNNYWRFCILLMGLFAFIQLIGFLFFFKHETPFYVFMTTHNQDKTMEVLNDNFSKREAKLQFEELKRKFCLPNQKEVGFTDLFKRKYFTRFLVAFVMAIVFNTSGLNTINVYSTQIFQDLGKSQTVSITLSMISAIPDLLGVYLGFKLINTAGRKRLYQLSVFSLFVNNMLIAIFGWLGMPNGEIPWVMMFRFCWCFGIGSVYFGYTSEILPLVGIAFVSVLYNLVSFCVLFTYPYMRDTSWIGVEGSFAFYAITMILSIPFLQKYMKEISGLTIDQIDQVYDEDKRKSQKELCVELLEADSNEKLNQQ